MNIAILGIKTHPAFAGADRVVEKLLENYPAGHDYYVYVVKDGRPSWKGGGNVHLVSVPAFGGKHFRPFSYFLLCSIHCVFNRKIDVAHVHNSDFGLFCAILRLRRKLRILGTFHGNPYERGKWGRFAKWYLRLSDRLFLRCCHHLTTVARSKIDECEACRRDRVSFIPNGVDSYWDVEISEKFDFAAHDLTPGEFVLFASGRMDSTKGAHHLVEAYEKGECREKLLILGDFSHDRAYSERILRECAENRNIVVVRDLVPRETLIDIIRNCKICVLPSEVEAMSMMLLEVISCKRPVVCSDIRENVDVVGEDYPYLFSSGNADALRRKLIEALGDPARERVAEALFSSCMARFSWSSVARRYVELYSVLTGR